MIYSIIIDGERQIYTNIPKDLNQGMALKVLLKDQNWVVDDTFSSYKAGNIKENAEKYEYYELLHPNLFVDEGSSGLVPDMDYFGIIDGNYFEKMIDYWSKLNDYSAQSLLDKIDENKEELINSAIVIDILE